MVDFRKWLLAFAVVALLVGLGSSTAYAQGGFTCNANAGTPHIVRVEGVAEEVGDLILNCTGGTPTTGGLPIPLQNVQISLNTNVTSRIVQVAGSISEALILIDEPFPTDPVPATQTPSANQPLAQQACLAVNNTNCLINSDGVGIGAAGSYKGVDDIEGHHFNVFQGFQSGVSAISWNGIPIDAPGTAGTRIIRITNIRANACLLGGSSTLVPTQIFELIGINGSQTITINNPNQIVAESELGLTSAVVPGPSAYTQCIDVNTFLLTPPGTTDTDDGITVNAKEGFAAAFKPQNYGQVLSALGGTYAGPGGTTLTFQNVPAFSYDTESGFRPDPAIGVISQTQPFVDPSGVVGLATQGTQLTFTVAGVGAGVSIFAPSYVYLSGNYGTGTPMGVAVLLGQTAPAVVLAPATPAPGPPAQLTVTGTTASVIYEIYYADPSVNETMSVPISVAFAANTANNLPAPGTSTVTVSFAPLSTTPTASSTAPIPRFCQNESPATLFSIAPCTCNLLFPFVTNQGGFDTGIAIANTSQDPFNPLDLQSGVVLLNYYGNTTGGGAAPPAFTTTSKVPGGQELIFTLSNGGNFGTPATPGFQGYIIATAQFQYCHGFAFISDVGAQKLAEGYLAIQLDIPFLNRTLVPGENEGH